MALILLHRACVADSEARGLGHFGQQARVGCLILTMCVHPPWEVRRYSVGRDCLGLLGERIHSTRTEAGLAGGDRAQYDQTHRQRCVYDEGQGRKIAHASSLVPGEVPQRTLRLVTNSPSHKPQAPFKLLLPSCISVHHFLCCLF